MSVLYMGCPAMTGLGKEVMEGAALVSPDAPPEPNPPWQESPTPTPLHFIHFVRPPRSAGKASKSSLYCTRRATKARALLSHFLDVPLDSGGGFVGINANINIKQLPGTPEQSGRLDCFFLLFFFLRRSGGGAVMCGGPGLTDARCVTTGTGKQRSVSEILLNGGVVRWLGLWGRESGEFAEDAFRRREGRE